MPKRPICRPNWAIMKEPDGTPTETEEERRSQVAAWIKENGRPRKCNPAVADGAIPLAFGMRGSNPWRDLR